MRAKQKRATRDRPDPLPRRAGGVYRHHSLLASATRARLGWGAAGPPGRDHPHTRPHTRVGTRRPHRKAHNMTIEAPLVFLDTKTEAEAYVMGAHAALGWVTTTGGQP